MISKKAKKDPKLSRFSITPILHPKTRELQNVVLYYDTIPLVDVEFSIDMKNKTLRLNTGDTVKLIVNEPLCLTPQEYIEQYVAFVPEEKAKKIIASMKRRNKATPKRRR